jgi:hypothetical protein
MRVFILLLLFISVNLNAIAQSLGTVTAHNTRSSAPLLTLSGAPNNCSSVSSLQTGVIQIRNLGGATNDNNIASQTCFQNTQSSTTNKNVWVRINVPAGSAISGFYFYSTTAGVTPQPSSSSNLRTAYVNVYSTAATPICTPAILCGSIKFVNHITDIRISAPHIRTVNTPRVDVMANTTYYVEIWTTSFSTDPDYNFDIHVVPMGARPSNELCTNAEPYETSPQFCNLGARPACNAYIPSCWFTLENSVFYTFTRPEGSTFQITINNVNCTGGGNSMQTALFYANTSNCTSSLTSGNMIGCRDFTGTYTYTVTDAMPPGTIYMLWFDGNAGAFCNWNIVVLPVEFDDFNVRCSNNQNECYWNTISEINNHYFTIERSADGINFTTAGYVTGNGTVNSPSQYSFTDKNAPDGTHYYRLKQTDYDGSTVILKTVALDPNSCKSKSSLDVYPNPVYDILYIDLRLDSDSKTNAVICDMSGRYITTAFSGNMEQGSHTIQKDIKDLFPGVYYMKVTIGNEIINQKIIKQ